MENLLSLGVPILKHIRVYAFSSKFSITFTEILFMETSDFLQQMIFLKSFNSVFKMKFRNGNGVNSVVLELSDYNQKFSDNHRYTRLKSYRTNSMYWDR